MDPILLALINSLKRNLDAQMTSVLSGVDDYEIDGLNLIIKLKDGAERVMTFPEPVDVDEINLENDSNDKVHLIIELADGTKFDCGEIPAGLSAYDIAVQNGYEGSEAEWLATLPGRRDPVRFDFPTASTEWNIQHNMNDKYLRITIFDEDGDEVANPVIERYSPNLSIAHFDIPIAGYAIVS